MAQPTTRTTFKDYCKRRLGWPVVELNLDDDQVEVFTLRNGRIGARAKIVSEENEYYVFKIISSRISFRCNRKCLS